VKCARSTRILHCLLIPMVFCAFAVARADTPGPSPQFTVQTLDGDTFNNAALRGRVILLQFWATQCSECRADQAALDDVERMYAGQGLVVLAIDVGESETSVKNYLRASPRSVRIVVNAGNSLAARFGVQSFPYYVAIDSQGNIVGTQTGAGGVAGLRRLLGLAGLSLQADVQDVGEQSAVVSRGLDGAAVIEVPAGQSARPERRIPKTIFVFANGNQLEADRYTIDPTSLHVVVNGQKRTIALSELDLNATIAVNRQRGVDLTIPKKSNEVFVTF
jgi:thiol-disulfide isomerase/thioredoxin